MRSSSLQISKTSPFYFSNWIDPKILVCRSIWAFPRWHRCRFIVFYFCPKIAQNVLLRRCVGRWCWEWSVWSFRASLLRFWGFGRSWSLWQFHHHWRSRPDPRPFWPLLNVIQRPRGCACVLQSLMSFFSPKAKWCRRLYFNFLTVFIELYIKFLDWKASEKILWLAAAGDIIGTFCELFGRLVGVRFSWNVCVVFGCDCVGQGLHLARSGE